MQDMYTQRLHLHITETYKTRSELVPPKDSWIRDGWIVGLDLL
jgi:hypothetical protein